MCRYGAPIPQTHDLTLLVDRLNSLNFPLPEIDQKTDFEDLVPFATLRRYEEGKFEITKNDLIDSIELSQQIIDGIQKELK